MGIYWVQTVWLVVGLTSENLSEPDEDEVQRLVRVARVGGAQGRRAFEEIYRWYAPCLQRALRPLCKDESETNDVVQDTFIRAWRNIARYEPRPGIRFVSWLITIGRNNARKFSRRMWRWITRDPHSFSSRDLAALPTGESASPAHSPEEELVLQRRKEALLVALGELAHRDRELLSLYDGAQLTAAEVGAILHLKPEAVRKRSQRLRTRLRPRLEELLS